MRHQHRFERMDESMDRGPKELIHSFKNNEEKVVSMTQLCRPTEFSRFLLLFYMIVYKFTYFLRIQFDPTFTAVRIYVFAKSTWRSAENLASKYRYSHAECNRKIRNIFT